MAKDRDNIRSLYEQVIEESLTPLAVKSNAKGDGETGGLEPGDLPADTKSTTEVQKGTGAENAKDVKAPEEADETLSPVKKNKGTEKTATKKTVTEDSAPRKSFMDLFNQTMVKEEGEDIESPSYDDQAGDFPETDTEVEPEVEPEGEELGEGEIYSQLSELFARLASLKGVELGGEEGGEESDLGAGAEGDLGAGEGGEVGPEGDVGAGEMPPRSESVENLMEMRSRLAKKILANPERYHKHQIDKAKTIIDHKKRKAEGKEAVGEAVSHPEPEELHSDISQLQAPRKLAGKGVVAKGGKASTTGSDKKRTGELETGPEGFKHDKSKFAVKGDGPVHNAKKGSDPSFLES